jgi:hypothetical protein
MDACREALIANDIWLSQYPVPVESGHMGLVTKQTHAESGQWQSFLLGQSCPYPRQIPKAMAPRSLAAVGIHSQHCNRRRYLSGDDGIMAGMDTPARTRRKKQMTHDAATKRQLLSHHLLM